MSDKNKRKSKSKNDQPTGFNPEAIQELIGEAEFSERQAAEDELYRSPKFGISTEETELGLGVRLQEAREAKKLTQGQLADLTKEADPQQTGISRAVISMYEVGKNRPSPRELRLLCEALRISPNHLIYGDEDPFGNLWDSHRWGNYSNSDAEFNALFIYTFHQLHHHHKLAIIQLINGLLLGWGKGTVGSHAEDANLYLLNLANDLKQTLEKRNNIKK